MEITKIVAALIAAGAVGTAHADFVDAETGNTTGDATDIGTFASSFAELGEGSVTDGDVDWFSFTITNDSYLQFNFLAGEGDDASLQLVNSAGMVVMQSVSGGFPLAIQEVDLLAGTYFVGVSGFDSDTAGDDSIMLDGMDSGVANTENFSYKLSVAASIVPLPTAALAGLGILIPLGVKRRMSRRG